MCGRRTWRVQVGFYPAVPESVDEGRRGIVIAEALFPTTSFVEIRLLECLAHIVGL